VHLQEVFKRRTGGGSSDISREGVPESDSSHGKGV